MSTDIDINEMFNEKNQALFLDKLSLDLDNNANAFKLATKHIVMVEIAKLLSALKRVYSKYSVDFNEITLKEVLSKLKTTLIDDINIIIDEKKANNKIFLKNDKKTQINNGYLKEYHKHIAASEIVFKDALNLSVKEVAEVNLYKTLLKLHNCVNEEMQQELLQLINIDFSGTIISRVINESKHRNMTLKNMSEEDYQKYLSLSKKSIGQKSNVKVKSKKETQ